MNKENQRRKEAAVPVIEAIRILSAKGLTIVAISKELSLAKATVYKHIVSAGIIRQDKRRVKKIESEG